ncbi:copper homeostasis protein CutC [Kineosporia sp. NBRC 101731]|uniref:copper homeostasis protein CutC n=1 Tax=Kineosporia sp. NBRC 101731 TaxID=3032199 RepID=UPI0024A27FF6|nr:copper homeostasis protein CutC [Kineosporia sp. NBRC 101731]GLY31734.1 copper homeostasis protein CutC [Kineosporia sp. NBRC 101731]
MTLLEICLEDAAGAAVAEAAGADRVEICSALSEGGVTPSGGLVHRVLASTSRIGVQVLIRPRGGDFVFSPAEVEVMIEDVRQLRSLPRVGFVLGALSVDGHVDVPVLERLLEACDGAPTTFHRAFDACRDLPASLEILVGLGFDRVLTSGGAASALEGAAVLRALTEQAAGRLTVLAGGGVRPSNVAELVQRAGVAEVHGRASETVGSAALFSNPAVPYDAAVRGVTSRAAVEAMRKALDEEF